LNIWDDKNQWNTTDHPQIDNVVYQGINKPCYSNLLKKHASLGQISAEKTISHIIPVSSTGDLHAVVYDLTDNFMYVSNGRPHGEEGPEKACDRTFIKLDMTKIFSEKPPL
jgi:hypothetical protein